MSLEAKRKDVELQKERVDRLNLVLENLLYKQAYLRREIRLCKDLSTPNLFDVEKETLQQLGATQYHENLQTHHEESLSTLELEMKERSNMEAQLKGLRQKHQAIIDKLDKKRKFLEELPTRVAIVKAASADIQNQFSQVMQEV